MRTQTLLLLLVTLYCGGVNAADAATGLKPTLGSTYSVRISKRLLRAQEPADLSILGNASPAKDEERGGNGAWVSRLAEADNKVSALRKSDMKLSQTIWLKWGKDPEYVFKLWAFNRAWPNIDGSKKTAQWFRFTKAYREKNGVGSFPDYEIYKLLSTKAPEYKLAITFESLKQIPDVKSLAETMQKYQFKRWINEKQTPTSIGKLLGIPHSTALTTERGPKDAILRAFTEMYSGGRTKLMRSATFR